MTDTTIVSLMSFSITIAVEYILIIHTMSNDIQPFAAYE